MKLMPQAKSIFLSAVIVMFSLTACKDKAALLTRTWKLENLKYSTPVPPPMQASIDKSIQELRDNFILTYNADGTYSTKMGEQTLKGKWKLNWNSSQITATTDAGEERNYTIVELNDKQFQFEATEGKDKVIFVMSAAK